MDPISPSAKLNPLLEAIRADLKKILDGEIFDQGVIRELISKAGIALEYIRIDQNLPPLVSRAGTPMEHGANVQLGEKIEHPAVRAIAAEVNGKSLRELATDPDA